MAQKASSNNNTIDINQCNTVFGGILQKGLIMVLTTLDKMFNEIKQLYYITNPLLF